MENGTCISAQFFEGPLAKRFYTAFGIISFFAYWAIPFICFLFFYGKVAISMQRRKRDSNFESNR